jgi:hypothetical protein
MVMIFIFGEGPPNTSLAWMYIYFNNAGQLQGGYLILLIFAILFDIGVFLWRSPSHEEKMRE